MKKSTKFADNPAQAIHVVREVLFQPYCFARMNTSGLKGFLGELLVGELLQSAGYTVRHFGNQHGTDLDIPSLHTQIDVKTSLLKEEIPGWHHWGWALLSGSKRKALKFTHVVCVALDERLHLNGMVVVRREDISQFPAGISPFTKNTHILVVPQPGQTLPATVKSHHRRLAEHCEELGTCGKYRHAKTADDLVAIFGAHSSHH